MAEMQAGHTRERRTTLIVLLIVGVLLILFGISIVLMYAGGGHGGITHI